MTNFDTASLRHGFSALQQTWDGKQAVFFDNPGGTQVPDVVIEAVSRYYREQNANVGGAFHTSKRTDSVLAEARQAMADLLNAPDPHSIIFGANMTTLTFHLAHSIAETITPGDEIVITNLDHDANVSPWTDLQAQGAVLKIVDINTHDCTLPLDGFQNVLTERTKLVAVTHASNAVGTIPDVAAIIRMVHAVGALVFVDAVQYAPHGPIDVQALDCDFLACSAYKFFGPHVGVLFGKTDLMESLTPHKVQPAKTSLPYRWETGTLNHEGIAGTAAAITYLESLENLHEGRKFAEETQKEDHSGKTGTGRQQTLKRAMQGLKDYEQTLSNYFLTRLQEIEDVTLYGLEDPKRLSERVPTFAFTWPRLSPRATVEHLAQHGIACYSGNYYALRLMERLGLEAEGGAVRIGLAHYNTTEEIDRLIVALQRV